MKIIVDDREITQYFQKSRQLNGQPKINTSIHTSRDRSTSLTKISVVLKM
jgi:hypothetical protein